MDVVFLVGFIEVEFNGCVNDDEVSVVLDTFADVVNVATDTDEVVVVVGGDVVVIVVSVVDVLVEDG